MNTYRKKDIPEELMGYFEPAELGREKTVDEFIEKMVGVFREVRRVLRNDGTLWLNMGDCYNSNSTGGKRQTGFPNNRERNRSAICRSTKCPGLKPKDLVGQAWMLAFALRADGWFLRQDIIWHKPNPMPESVTDRCTKAHEYIFLLTKSPRYFCDMDAIREKTGNEATQEEYEAADSRRHFHEHDKERGMMQTNPAHKALTNPLGRNCRSVWTIPTQACPEAHFATFPEALPTRCIRAGTSEKGCCPECGKPWRRIIESERVRTRPGKDTKIKVPGGWEVDPGAHGAIHRTGRTEATYRDAAEIGNRDPGRHVTEKRTVGWEASCYCQKNAEGGPVPCRVLDPFHGAGTTTIAGCKLGRDCTGIELNGEYVTISIDRIEKALRPNTYVQASLPKMPEEAPLFLEVNA